MNYPKNFKTTDRFFNPYKFDRGNFTLKGLINSSKTYSDFMGRFELATSQFIDICKLLGIKDSDLFEYSTYGKILYKEDAIYTERCIRRYGCGYDMEKTYYNIYIVVNQFASLALNKVAEYVVLNRFPFLKKYTINVKRFKDDINEIASLNLNTKVSSLDSIVLFHNELTIADLIRLFTDSDYKDSSYDKSLVCVYENGRIFITLPTANNSALYIEYKDLANKDIESILKRHVFSIPYYDENGEQIKGKWFEGEQKDAPYFDCEMVNDILSNIKDS